MVSPFLLRAVLDTAIPDSDTGLLVALVAGMIAIAVATGALGVAQTLLSNTVGQRVMHDLRAAVYRHLQRLSLAFFTRTRTGEIQSRIANDIGGRAERRHEHRDLDRLQRDHGARRRRRRCSCSTGAWRCSRSGLLPFFVWLTRRVGEERRRITAVRQGRLADISALVEESLSVSGILLGKTMGRSGELAERFERESAELADLEVRSRMAGRWRMASVQIAFAAMPALVYLFAGLSDRQRRAGDHDRHPGRLHHAADAALLPDPVAALGRRRRPELAGAVRARVRLPRPAGRDRGARRRARDPAERGPGRGRRSRASASATRPDGDWTLRDIDLDGPAGTTLALVGETGSGKTTLAYLLARLYDVEEGAVTIDGIDVRDLSLAGLAGIVGVVSQETYLFHASIATTCASRSPDADRRRDRGARRGRPRSTT